MENTRIVTFPPGRSAERLDRFLAEALPELSRSHLKKLITEGRVRVDGAGPKAGTLLRGGEEIVVTLPAPEPIEAQPEAIPLSVLFEDRHLIVIDKPAGLVVHPAPGHARGTLVNALLYHCRDLSGVGGALRPGIVHRLDRDTSGVMVATKDDTTHQALGRQFKSHSITRKYVALIHGSPRRDAGTVNRSIGRHPAQRKKMSARTRSGRRAVTHWRVLRRYDRDRLTLVELTLETGRTHQIRVHFAEMNLPVVADPVYGSSRKINAIADVGLRQRVQELKRQALHARTLGFVHPASGEYLEFETPPPPDMQQILDYLETSYRSEAEE